MGSLYPPGCAARFRPIRCLASGGFGQVWLANQEGLQRKVAVKILLEQSLRDPEQVRRFREEARVTALLSHPSIVVLIDHGVDDGVPWIVYEYLPGPTLREHIQRGPLPWRTAAEAALRIGTGLAVAHARGVLHRDIKPENILAGETGLYKIADFGIARWSGRQTRTAAGMILGTPAYMAPELCRGGEPSAASDLYAMGVVLFEMLTGRLPFEDPTPVGMLHRHVEDMPAPVRSLAPGVPAALDALVARRLAKAPGERPASAEDMVGELEQLLASPLAPDTPGTAPGRRRGAASSGTIAMVEHAPAPRDTIEASRGRVTVPQGLAGIGLALIAGVAIGSCPMTRRPSPGPLAQDASLSPVAAEPGSPYSSGGAALSATASAAALVARCLEVERKLLDNEARSRERDRQLKRIHVLIKDDFLSSNHSSQIATAATALKKSHEADPEALRELARGLGNLPDPPAVLLAPRAWLRGTQFTESVVAAYVASIARRDGTPTQAANAFLLAYGRLTLPPDLEVLLEGYLGDLRAALRVHAVHPQTASLSLAKAISILQWVSTEFAKNEQNFASREHTAKVATSFLHDLGEERKVTGPEPHRRSMAVLAELTLATWARGKARPGELRVMDARVESARKALPAAGLDALSRALAAVDEAARPAGPDPAASPSR